MGRGLVALVVLAACGRLGYEQDELAAGADGAAAESGVIDAGGTGAPGGDGADGGATPDGASASADGETCATARPLQIDVPLVDESIAGATDDLDGDCADGVEVIYRFTLASPRTLRIEPSLGFSGAYTIDGECTPQGGACGTGGSSTSGLAAGDHYIIIDKTGGGGTTFDLSVSTP